MKQSTLFATVLAVAALGAQGAQAARTATPQLYVNFFASGTIAVTLPDGTPIGVTSGTPTTIPAGYYQLVFSGPGGCSALPYFHLTGPGTNIVANMNEGLAQKTQSVADLQPNSTYQWSSDAFPGVMHTFATSAVVEGTAPPQAATPPKPTGKAVSSSSLIGSAVGGSAKTLAVTVTGSHVAVAAKRLPAGRYTLTVRGALPLLVTTPTHKRLTIAKRQTALALTAGRWLFGATALTVSA